MQRILNNPDFIVDEMLKGFVKIHSDIVETTDKTLIAVTSGEVSVRGILGYI